MGALKFFEQSLQKVLFSSACSMLRGCLGLQMLLS